MLFFLKKIVWALVGLGRGTCLERRGGGEGGMSGFGEPRVTCCSQLLLLSRALCIQYGYFL